MPQRIESGTYARGRDDGATPFWSHYERHAATTAQPIEFSRPFAAAPTVIVGLSRIGMEQGGHKLVGVRARGISPEGFSLIVESGMNTQVDSLEAFWIAFGDDD